MWGFHGDIIVFPRNQVKNAVRFQENLEIGVSCQEPRTLSHLTIPLLFVPALFALTVPWSTWPFIAWEYVYHDLSGMKRLPPLGAVRLPKVGYS